MLDLSMGEIGLIAVVALVVLGPDKLPAVAKTAGTLMGKAQRFVSQVKNDIDREVELSELKKIQEDARRMAANIENDLKTTQNELQKDVDSMNQSLKQIGSEVKSEIDYVSNDLRDSWVTSTAPKSNPSDSTQSVEKNKVSTEWDDEVSTIDTQEIDDTYGWPEDASQDKAQRVGKRSVSSPTVEDLMREIEMLRAELGKQALPQRRGGTFARGSRINRTRITR